MPMGHEVNRWSASTTPHGKRGKKKENKGQREGGGGLAHVPVF